MYFGESWGRIHRLSWPRASVLAADESEFRVLAAEAAVTAFRGCSEHRRYTRSRIHARWRLRDHSRARLRWLRQYLLGDGPQPEARGRDQGILSARYRL